MASPKQIAANRRNAQKSTGPTSDQGKQTVAQNNFRHGLRGKFRVLDDIENPYEYEAFLDRLIADEKPVGEAELALVVKMAETTWLSKRALALQADSFRRDPDADDPKHGPSAITIDHHLERFVRYQAAQDRAYARASSELQKRKKERRLAEIGFKRQKRADAEETRKAEKHKASMSLLNTRRQREEIKLGTELAAALGPNFDPSAVNSLFSGNPSTAQMTSRLHSEP